LSNPIYVEKFAYLGPHVKNRERYLNDPDNDPQNNFLQSDVVTLLLNLCCIPDEVAQKFELNYFDTYFNQDILRHMETFKQNFNERRSIAWDFSNQANIELYIEKCLKKESEHRTPKYLEQLQKEKIEYWKKNQQTRRMLSLYTEMKSVVSIEERRGTRDKIVLLGQSPLEIGTPE
jgi:hypothetical protein